MSTYSKPTQAQIEAAAEAIRKQHYKGIVNFIDLATAALTAAAEVERLAPGCCSAISPCAHQREHPETICAQCTAATDPALRDFIKDTPISEPNDGWAVEQNLLKVCLERIEATGKALEAQTIERCAQVADKWLAYGVAEDIRALKDKP